MGKKNVWSFEGFEDPRFLGDSWFWFRNFLEGKSRSTRRNYIHDLKGFMEHYDYTTESLFQEQLRNCNDNGDPRRKKIIGMKLVSYQRHLMESEGKASGTVDNIFKAVKAFFRVNELDFQLNDNRIKVDKKEINSIQKEEIQIISDICGSVRFKALMHLLKDGGMRVGDASLVRMETIRPVLEGDTKVRDDREFFTWELKQEKTGRMANPVIGPEAIDWIRKWVGQMERMGIESEWLFCTVGNYSTYKSVGDRSSGDNFGQLFRHYRDNAGLEGISIHSLRKYHKTNLEYAGVPASWVNKMQGRKGEGTGGIYTKPNPDQLIDVYSKAYPILSLEVQLDAEVEEQKEKIAELEAKVLEMTSAFLVAQTMIERRKDFEELRGAPAEL